MSIPKSLIWLSICIALWSIAFYDAIFSASSVWMQSATYNHCLFVIPISIYLISQEITNLTQQRVKPFYPALIGILILILLWGIGFAGHINVFQHAAVFGILPLLVLAVLGLNVAKVIWFPLLFSLFSIPVGEELIPLFQVVTADISVKMLVWSGIPVFREGLFIQVPEGKFLVAEACSGIRFFVSTVMLGALCSYLFFNSFKKRLAFLLFSIILPIIANAIRAYGIMLVGHLSGMEYAVGADHLIYGWVFFAIVTILLIYIAYFFRETDIHSSPELKVSEIDKSWFVLPSKIFMSAIILIFFCLFSWKFVLTKSGEKHLFNNINSLQSIAVEISQTKLNKSNDWQPIFNKSDLVFSGNAKAPYNDIKLHFRGFSGANNAELISWNNRIFEPDRWTVQKSNVQKLMVNGLNIPVQVINVVSNSGVARTIIYWYQVPGFIHYDRLKIKIRQAVNVLLGKANGGALLAVSSVGENKDAYLVDWLQANYDAIAQAYLVTEQQR